LGVSGLTVVWLLACTGPQDTGPTDTVAHETAHETGDTAAALVPYVCPQGGDFATIQAALDATDGDVTLSLCPARFQENVVTGARSVTLTSTAGGDTTWLDAGRNGPAITSTGESSVLTLVGISVRNGVGGGVVAEGTVSATGVYWYDSDGPAVQARQVEVGDGRIGGEGVVAETLLVSGTLWEGEGDFSTGDVDGKNVTLVQTGLGSLGVGGAMVNAIVVGAFAEWAGDLRYTDVWGSTQTLGVGSFSADPLFEAGTEYTLSAGSPCVDAGEGQDADGTPADLGWAAL